MGSSLMGHFLLHTLSETIRTVKDFSFFSLEITFNRNCGEKNGKYLFNKAKFNSSRRLVFGFLFVMYSLHHKLPADELSFRVRPCAHWVTKRGRCYCSCTSLFVTTCKYRTDFKLPRVGRSSSSSLGVVPARGGVCSL